MTADDSGDAARRGAVSLGIDIGSTNVKVVLIRADESVHESAVCSAPTPRDADELVRTVLDLVRSVVVSAQEPPVAVGIASMAESGVPLGSGDRALLPIVRWDGEDDSRDLERLVERFGKAELYAATGVPALPKTPLAMWARLRRRQPEVWSELRRWSGVADLIGLALTGVLATDHTLAARTMAYRLPGQDKAGFDPALLDAVGLTPDSLPAVREPGDSVGPVHPAAARRTGLPEGIPVYIAGHDHSVGAWAAGARAAGDVADSIGTAEALIRVLDRDPDLGSVRGTGMSVTRTVDGAPALLAGSSSAGAFARWWFAHRIGGREPGEVMRELANDTVPTGITVLPYLNGRQTPQPDPRAKTRVVGPDGVDLDPRTVDEVTLARAMLEGLSLQARWMLAAQAELVGSETAPIRVLGGPGGGNRPWMTAKAQVYPVASRLTVVAEPVASGAALLAAARAGALPNGVPELPSQPLERRPGDPYGEAFERFVAAASRTP